MYPPGTVENQDTNLNIEPYMDYWCMRLYCKCSSQFTSKRFLQYALDKLILFLSFHRKCEDKNNISLKADHATLYSLCFEIESWNRTFFWSCKKIIDNNDIAYIYSYYSYFDFKVCQLVIIFLRTWMFYLIKTEQDRFFRYSLSHSQHYFAKNFLTRLSSMNILEICLPQVFLFLKVIGTWTQKVKTFEHN